MLFVCVYRRTAIDGTPKFDNGLKSAASTLASIVSRQAFDIPRKASDSDNRDDDVADRLSLPDIGSAGDVNVGGSGAFARRDTPAPRNRDPFGSPVTPLQQTYNSYRHHADNARNTAAAAATETAAASGWIVRFDGVSCESEDGYRTSWSSNCPIPPLQKKTKTRKTGPENERFISQSMEFSGTKRVNDSLELTKIISNFLTESKG